MAWPKKGTRSIAVEGIDLLWHYSGHCPSCSDAVFTIGAAGEPHVLFIDPYPWGFEYRPRDITAAVRWAFAQGWTPASGPTRAMSFDDGKKQFVWLPEGRRHLACAKESGETDRA